MNATKLLEELQRRDVRLWIQGEGTSAALGYEAPPGVLKPPVLAAMKASKHELLLLLEAASQAGAQAAPVSQAAPVEVEPEPQVLAAAPSPVEVLRPDLREPLGLAALDLDLDPLEDAPTHPAWRTPATWNAQHGLWERCGGIVPTTATAGNVRRYREAKRPQVLAAASTCGQAPDPRALPESATPLFIRNLKAARLKLGEKESARDVHDFAHAVTLLDLGRDPVTGLACVPTPREMLPVEFDAGAAYDPELATEFAHELFARGLVTVEQRDRLLATAAQVLEGGTE